MLRWTWRVGYYSYSALGTDRYPPFTLRDVPDYPARLEIDYPESLSRGQALVKWWLLALPQYLIIAALATVAACWSSSRAPPRVHRPLPRALFDLTMGMERWTYRVVAYASLMTDVYPPFRLDAGAEPVASLA